MTLRKTILAITLLCGLTGLVRAQEADQRLTTLQYLGQGAEDLAAVLPETPDNLADWEKSLLVSSMQKIAFMMHADNLDAAPILEVGDINDSGA